MLYKYSETQGVIFLHKILLPFSYNVCAEGNGDVIKSMCPLSWVWVLEMG